MAPCGWCAAGQIDVGADLAIHRGLRIVSTARNCRGIGLHLLKLPQVELSCGKPVRSESRLQVSSRKRPCDAPGIGVEIRPFRRIGELARSRACILPALRDFWPDGGGGRNRT